MLRWLFHVHCALYLIEENAMSKIWFFWLAQTADLNCHHAGKRVWATHCPFFHFRFLAHTFGCFSGGLGIWFRFWRVHQCFHSFIIKRPWSMDLFRSNNSTALMIFNHWLVINEYELCRFRRIFMPYDYQIIQEMENCRSNDVVSERCVVISNDLIAFSWCPY